MVQSCRTAVDKGYEMHGSKTWLIHSLIAASANELNKHNISDLPHGKEQKIYGDSAYSQTSLLTPATENIYLSAKWRTRYRDCRL
jgi:hypothetical protein